MLPGGSSESSDLHHFCDDIMVRGGGLYISFCFPCDINDSIEVRFFEQMHDAFTRLSTSAENVALSEKVTVFWTLTVT